MEAFSVACNLTFGAEGGFFQLLRINRLQQVVDCRAEGADGVFVGGGYENDARGKIGKYFEQVEPRTVAEQNIQKNDIGRDLAEEFGGCDDTSGRSDDLHFRAIFGQVVLKSLHGLGHVFYDDCSHF